MGGSGLGRFGAALGLWLSLGNLVARRGGLTGLSWSDGRLAGLLGLLGLLGRPGPWALLGALPLAAGLQIGLAALRRPGLNPRLRLRPGAYGDRRIARVDVPAAHGPVPALEIVPAGGARAAVLVAHGSGCDKTFYAWRLADALVAEGLAALLIDLDGHGESPRPQSFPEIVAGVAGPLAWLRGRYGGVGLIGMSLGGAVAARALAGGAPCDAAALWAVPPRLRLSAAEYRQAQRAEALGIARPSLLHLFRDGSAYHVARGWQTSGIRARIGTWDLFDALDVPGALAALAARPDRPPLLLYYAGRDGVLRPGADREVEAAVAGWGELRRVAGASHVSLAIEPEVIAGTVSWLGARLAG